ncbi:MAG: hypothetical protein IKS93_02210 [Methanobrevibacter sp.]|nr:hypothetical protein [Methanobrevibacter sp.]
MTEEEYFRKNYPDSCYGDKPLSPYWDFFQDGVEFGERQSEKKIEELENQNKLLGERCNQLLKDKGDLTDELDELDERTKDLLNANHKIGQLEKQIEKLKTDLNEAIEDANRWEETETFSVLNHIYNDNFEVITSVSN